MGYSSPSLEPLGPHFHIPSMPGPWMAPDLTLTGRLVSLVPLHPSHAPDLYAVGQDPEIWRYVPIPMRSLSDMAEYVRAAVADRDRGEAQPFAILSRADGSVLGSTRYYALAEKHRNLEIGYTWLKPSAWRSPINSECKLLLLRHAFESLGCLRVSLRTDVRNLRSRRAIERLGATQEGVFRKHMILPDGHVRDTVYYSLTDEEWPKARDFLAASLEAPAESLSGLVARHVTGLREFPGDYGASPGPAGLRKNSLSMSRHSSASTPSMTSTLRLMGFPARIS